MAARANMKGTHKRLLQEMAAHRAMRENALASLREIVTSANKQGADARRLIALLQPSLLKWCEAGQPANKRMARHAKMYMKAVESLHDAEYAEQHARNLLEEYEEAQTNA